ncbi:hypothetical protein DPEC_G00062750 [Dallia pectoralis]|uniref:Uncharacterized protein n=1 Tax=Dallia pectoralis TaxID=75939 RepID=A0ACC2H7L3_DALPE|nr:hypothetical protein DPEC_G00062750 [Dallia pectoralis]
MTHISKDKRLHGEKLEEIRNYLCYLKKAITLEMLNEFTLCLLAIMVFVILVIVCFCIHMRKGPNDPVIPGGVIGSIIHYPPLNSETRPSPRARRDRNL